MKYVEELLMTEYFFFVLLNRLLLPLVRCKEYIEPVYLQENLHLETLNGANNAVSQLFFL